MSGKKAALESVVMIRENLDNILQCTFPSGYSIRWYAPGDEKHWLEIQSLADTYTEVRPNLFEREFGIDTQALSQRQCYLCDDRNRTIGTASAWFGALGGQSLGRVHWVAIQPKKQGLGLAKPLLAAVCGRLRSLGHSKAYLTTQTVRVPAINLYAKFGFRPLISSQADREIWMKLHKHIKYPLGL